MFRLATSQIVGQRRHRWPSVLLDQTKKRVTYLPGGGEVRGTPKDERWSAEAVCRPGGPGSLKPLRSLKRESPALSTDPPLGV